MVANQKDSSPFDIALGQILRIPCKFIKGKSDAQPIVIKAIAQELAEKGKNILPVVVRVLGEDKYQAILNTQVLDAAKQAKQDFVWCIVVDQGMQSQVEIETGQVVKVNVTTASEDELVSVLDFIRGSKTGFGKISPEKIAAAIVRYRQSQQITSLNFLTKAKCGIGKAKVPVLAENLVLS